MGRFNRSEHLRRMTELVGHPTPCSSGIASAGPPGGKWPAPHDAVPGSLVVRCVLPIPALFSKTRSDFQSQGTLRLGKHFLRLEVGVGIVVVDPFLSRLWGIHARRRASPLPGRAAHPAARSTAHPSPRRAARRLVFRLPLVRLQTDRCIRSLELIVQTLQSANLLVAQLQLTSVFEHCCNG